ncbi:hypothetical protein SARC_01098 [Sphaeroforma arctica JP610]|uniref:PPIase cyclophilin-type domain-containing protein n=1 Tax=Sphaeroforma arctica JP610 TaxID=667725 RepID=A0A0L0GCX2_9EUKA|nr:hypothetical protein SARC_01098 [Sphaeroforma arctica JP610]KNC86764.1 hypothetical protein SARC_01098 [Sphaeroforma arctica JP610]|eukprot:XP_014160666.1 hypothetical protein SARC_01098 [Sphaeroforma arctica JP610]
MSVTITTSLGDLKLELFIDLCPRACENFLALCGSGYYEGLEILPTPVKEASVYGEEPLTARYTLH